MLASLSHVQDSCVHATVTSLFSGMAVAVSGLTEDVKYIDYTPTSYLEYHQCALTNMCVLSETETCKACMLCVSSTWMH